MKTMLATLGGSGRSGVGVLENYRGIDCLVQGYLALVGLMVLVFHGDRVDGWPELVVSHLLAMCVIHLLVQRQAGHSQRGWLTFFRCFYPILIYTALYRETDLLNRMFVPEFLDPFFLALEQELFGFQPAVRFMAEWPIPLVSEMFYMAYFSYYPMILGLGIFLFRKDREWFFHYVTVLSVVLFGCYLMFIFLPVIGPPVLMWPVADFPEQARLPFYPLAYPPEVTSGPFFQIMASIYRQFESPGGAFPSSHVAAALCTLMFSWRYLNSFRYLHLVMVILLCLATVYCRYHYAVDVVGGVAAAMLLIPLGEYLYRRRP